jgi:hypothetical protein
VAKIKAITGWVSTLREAMNEIIRMFFECKASMFRRKYIVGVATIVNRINKGILS